MRRGVSSGVEVAFVDSANAGRRPEQVDLVRVRDRELPLILHFVWCADNASAGLSAFLAPVASKKNGSTARL